MESFQLGFVQAIEEQDLEEEKGRGGGGATGGGVKKNVTLQQLYNYIYPHTNINFVVPRKTNSVMVSSDVCTRETVSSVVRQ